MGKVWKWRYCNCTTNPATENAGGDDKRWQVSRWPMTCRFDWQICQWHEPATRQVCWWLLESVHMVLTQPGTLVSFRGMCIYLLFDFQKLWNFQCFPFPENSGTLTFPISRNSGLRCFLLLVIRSCISPFTCDSVVSPCFMLLFSLMYSGLSLYPVHTYPTP